MDVPGLATHFAIHDEGTHDIRLDVDLDLLTTERTGDTEIGCLGIFKCHRFSISLLPGAELGISISIAPPGDTIVVNHDLLSAAGAVQTTISESTEPARKAHNEQRRQCSNRVGG